MQFVVEVQARSNFLGDGQLFSAAAVSLESLLQYTDSVTAEDSAEVILVAELFKDMLDAHHGLGLLRSLACLEKQARRPAYTETSFQNTCVVL